MMYSFKENKKNTSAKVNIYYTKEKIFICFVVVYNLKIYKYQKKKSFSNIQTTKNVKNSTQNYCTFEHYNKKKISLIIKILKFNKN
jgi:hypothetical protein